MRAVLLDTGVLLRARHVTDAKHAVAVSAIESLVKAGWGIYVAPQCLQEYWAVATRPAEARGGLGLSPERAAMDVERILSVHRLLKETVDLFDEWKDIVTRYGVSGRQVWDARLAAVMRLHGVRHLLTFNVEDFRRFDFLRAWLPESVDILVQEEAG
jgi:predicted nucleic acid-binding protein